MRWTMLLCAATFATSTAAMAKTIYEPLQVQFGAENKYYYGGCDPRMHEVADAMRSPSGDFGRVHGYRLVTSRRKVEFELPRVYSDLYGSQDAYPYGYSADNAYNDAHSLVPRYFQKNLVATTTAPDPSGTRYVPAVPPCDEAMSGVPRGGIVIKPYRAPLRRGPVFIFPKTLLDRRLDDKRLDA